MYRPRINPIMERHVINPVTAVTRARNRISRKQRPVDGCQNGLQTTTVITNSEFFPAKSDLSPARFRDGVMHYSPDKYRISLCFKTGTRCAGFHERIKYFSKPRAVRFGARNANTREGILWRYRGINNDVAGNRYRLSDNCERLSSIIGHR